MAIDAKSWKRMPVAPRTTAYDYDDATRRIQAWAGGSAEKFSSAFLWRNPDAKPGSPDAYRLPIADVHNGKLVLIPRAVFSAATILSGAHGGLEDVTTEDERLELKSVVTDIYDMLREDYRDPRVKPPWLRGGNEESQVTASAEEVEVEDFIDMLEASVNSSGWASMPIADEDRGWDSGQARSRVWTWADGDYRKYRKAFLWWDATAPEQKGSYKLPIADVIDGTLTIVPRAVNAVAAVLGGARGGVNIPDADMDSVQAIVNRIQKRFHADDESVEAAAPMVGCGDCTDADECDMTDSDMIAACATCIQRREALSLEAAAIPTDPGYVAPDRSVFEPPVVTGPTPLTVTADGRVFGHGWLWNKCHAGIQNECVIAPRSASGYKYFLNGQVLTADGSMVKVGKITMGTGHAGQRSGWIPAADHYDNTGTQAAWVTVTEDAYGGMLAGIVAPGMTPAQIARLRTSPVSGDWRLAGGSLELVAALAVNTPGFPIVASMNGEVTAIIAAGMIMPDGTEVHTYGDDCVQASAEEVELAKSVDALDEQIAKLTQRGRGRRLQEALKRFDERKK